MEWSSFNRSLYTGNDSPVSMDSSTEKSFEWTIDPSADINVPSSTIRLSPTTNSSLRISTILPLRITLQVGCENFFSFSKAPLLLESWYKEMAETKIIAEARNIPSPDFPLMK